MRLRSGVLVACLLAGGEARATPPNAMCYVWDGSWHPSLDAPTVGANYVYQPEQATSYEDALAQCTDAVFQGLTAQYVGPAAEVYWRVGFLEALGWSHGCAASGCLHPSLHPNNTLCLVKDRTVAIPAGVEAESVDHGYVMKVMRSDSLADAQQRCTAQVFRNLVAEYTTYAYYGLPDLAGGTAIESLVVFYDTNGQLTTADAPGGRYSSAAYNSFCLVKDRTVAIPPAVHAPTEGLGYVMKMMRLDSLADAQQSCSAQVFRELVARYTEFVYYGDPKLLGGGLAIESLVVFYDAKGHHTTAAAPRGRYSWVPNATCAVWDRTRAYSPPAPCDKPEALGWAASAFHANSWDEVRDACTKTEMMRLMDEHTRRFGPMRTTQWLIDYRGANGHGPAPTAPSVHCAKSANIGCDTPLGGRAICIVRDETGPTDLWPNDPTTGKGYAFRRIDAKGFDDARAKCTDAIYHDLTHGKTWHGHSLWHEVRFWSRDDYESSGCDDIQCHRYPVP